MHDIYDSSLSHTKNTGFKTHKEASYNAIEVGEGVLSKGHQTSVLDTIFQSEMVHKLLLNMQFCFLSLDFSLDFSHLKSDIGMTCIKSTKKFPLSYKLYQHDSKCILNGISVSLGLMKKDHIDIIGKEKGRKVMQNSSTWYHISIGNGT